MLVLGCHISLETRRYVSHLSIQFNLMRFHCRTILFENLCCSSICTPVMELKPCQELYAKTTGNNVRNLMRVFY